MKTGLLLINLGTPDKPERGAVWRYLREFLMDRRVIDIPYLARWLLVNVLIAPRRSGESAKAYRKIWTDRGSPLRFHTEDLVNGVASRLQNEDARWELRYAMRYGKPSVRLQLADLRQAGVERLIVIPLYPQYALASSRSSIDALELALQQEKWDPPVAVVHDFFQEEGFIEAAAAIARRSLGDGRAGFEHYLFSFHGVPERHLRRIYPAGGGCLDRPSCCDQVNSQNRWCYRAQCFATARALARKLGITNDRFSVAFQSRLGRTPWIQPYTDQRIIELAGQGIRRLAVFSPSFVADCLETIEEIGIRAREDFVAHGGEELLLIPSLNSAPEWCDAVAAMARRAALNFGAPEHSLDAGGQTQKHTAP